MGIPRFFKMLTERYPLSIENQDTRGTYENFYIDMNGIIHMQTHDNGKRRKGQVEEPTWDDMAENIWAYVESVVSFVKPTELLYLSVDGPVCRMKMNQQRSRRFYKIAAEPTVGFDPNCISPGTEFMEFLQERMLEFIAKRRAAQAKIWSEVTVIFSGHRVPGEGEHKIISYIKNTAEQCSTKRHCIHGLDADLILLTLLTSMPHFSILREEMDFRNNRTGGFIFLHAHIIREYLCLETGMRANDKKAVNEAVNDIVFIMALFGNDFVPGIFNLLVSFDSLLILYRDYRRRTRVALHKNGRINWGALYLFLEEVVVYERCLNVHQALQLSPPEKLYTYRGVLERVLAKESAALVNTAKLFNQRLVKAGGAPMYTTKAEIQAVRLAKQPTAAQVQATRTLPVIDSAGKEAGQLLWDAMRETRYREKKIDVNHTFDYLMSLQWLCQYYFAECDSWSWFYPEHYSVFLTDVVQALKILIAENPNGSSLEIEKDLEERTGYARDGPISPFVQLLGILPAANKDLLPSALRGVFTELSEYYPTEFTIDQDGKKAVWESLCLIPFVDIAKIQAAVDKRIQNVPSADLIRNKQDVLRIWRVGATKAEEIPYERTFEAYQTLLQSVPTPSKAQIYIPSLFAKRVVSTMSKVMNSCFGGERKRMVLSLKPCADLMAALEMIAVAEMTAELEQKASWIFGGGYTYCGFPYLTPCQVIAIGYKKRVLAVEKDQLVCRHEELSPDEAEELEKAARLLFKRRGIFVQDRASYVICSVNGRKRILPLEVLVSSKSIQMV
ncbi:5'-3' exoribonuclease 1 [Nematocida homosporus]|uniref:5'-3' exoribonuclease 1 n=1 Tax=Nematocida homosporus TaxID=1912981 RepID=UPI00221FEFB6|nr:5'-3' exoribonuclease 1 [Nematocida homosporus]KAI5186255.1 5'-3' exoribonuclease 1 [Nematocida homosporus]